MFKSPVHTKKTKKAYNKKAVKDVVHLSYIDTDSRVSRSNVTSSPLPQSLSNTSVTSLISSASSRKGGGDSIVQSSIDGGSFNHGMERSTVKKKKAVKESKSKDSSAVISSGYSKQVTTSKHTAATSNSSSGGVTNNNNKSKTQALHSISVSNSLPLHYFNHGPNPTTNGHINHSGIKSSGYGSSNKSTKSNQGSVNNKSSSNIVGGGGGIMYDSSLFDMLDI